LAITGNINHISEKTLKKDVVMSIAAIFGLGVQKRSISTISNQKVSSRNLKRNIQTSFIAVRMSTF
jgi:hypothetical protein